MPTGKENAINRYVTANQGGRTRAALGRMIGARYLRHASGVRVGNKVIDHVCQNLNSGNAHWVTNDFCGTDAAGRIVDHRDAVEPVPPREEWANSGKL